MKRILHLLLVLSISNFIFAQNRAALENSFNINQATNISGGMSGGVNNTWVLTDGTMYVGNENSFSVNYFNNVNINKIAKLNALGILDTSYNQGGAGFNTNAAILDLDQQADGKILIGGSFTSYNGNTVSGIVRINQDGSIDPSFAVSNNLNGVRRMLIQPDGKILAVWAFTNTNGVSGNGILRLNQDGSLDTTFDSGTGLLGIANNFDLQPDGKILIVGAFTSYNNVAATRIARLNPDGSLDTSFVSGTGFNNLVNTVCVQPDGKILVGGRFTAYNGVSKQHIVRLESNGAIDATFTGASDDNIKKIDLFPDNKILYAPETAYLPLKKLNADGTVDTGFALGGGPAKDFVILPNNKVVVGGMFYSYQNTTVNTVARIDYNGLIDPGFSYGVGLDYIVHVVKSQPDNKILLGGEFFTYNNTPVKNLIRLNQDGTLDPTFNIGTGFDGFSIDAIDVQNNGKIIVGGNFTSFDGHPANYLVRLNADGSFDTAFATPYSSIASYYVKAVAVQPDGKVLAGHSNLTYVKRYNVDGTLDTTFSNPPSSGQDIKSIKLLPDGKILKGVGAFDGFSAGSFTRLNADGSLDPSFTVLPFSGGVYGMDVQPDGKMVVVGDFQYVNSILYRGIIRLNANGTVDTSFTLGAGLYGTGLNGRGYSVFVQPDGLIIVGGAFDTYLGESSSRLVGINPDGTRNQMFNIGTGFSGAIYSMDVQSDGKILVGGAFSNYNTYVVGCVARLLGGGYYSLSGQNKLDINANGCDASDIPFPNLKFHFNDGTNSYDFFSNVTGSYSFLLNAGNYTITPIISPNFNVSPTSITANFPSQFSSLVQNYCLTSVDNLYNDLDVEIIPVSGSAPGFNSRYRIVYKNKGVQTLSGSVNLNFEDSLMDYFISYPAFTTQATNVLSWDFTNLGPQELRIIDVIFNLNSPVETPPLNLGDIIHFTATISNLPNEATPSDNTFTLNQNVVNSYDPNDKTCLEGDFVSPAKIGDYVHYLIRFENNGTANAQFIRVLDEIDTSKFDISTLEPLHSSHNMITKISDGNKVEFFFDNINLPFDDANNDGYIMYKIKLKSNLVLGDSFSNTAEIYFDFNAPIITDPATTRIVLLNDQEFVKNSIRLYPNPVRDILNISQTNNEEIKSARVYNLLGQELQYIQMQSSQESINVSQLKTGNYILKLETENGILTQKFTKL